jgi:2-polyprenyl-3-methyl-5-hydroxy-6-metoxy-1,4-benzoquinol methylase
LGERAIHQNFNQNYLGKRFSNYELTLLNVKQMGYVLGRAEIEKSAPRRREFDLSKPSFSKVTSKLCTQSDCETEWFSYWLKEMQLGFLYHRKLWEFAFILQALHINGVVGPGKRGLGFGCGTEPLPSLFAKYGASVIATDLDPFVSQDEKQGWIESGQHGTSLALVRQSKLCPDAALLENVSHEFVDMNKIPDKFTEQFDFCWSACALEHVGSIELGLNFIENSAKTLKPGGCAVHTTEFNFDNTATIDNWPTVLFQRAHMESLAARLTDQGFEVVPFDFDPGSRILDGIFDTPPFPWEVDQLSFNIQPTFNYMKTALAGFPCTSIGIIVKAPA